MTNTLNLTEALSLCIAAQARDIELESAFDNRADSLVEALVKVIINNVGRPNTAQRWSGKSPAAYRLDQAALV